LPHVCGSEVMAYLPCWCIPWCGAQQVLFLHPAAHVQMSSCQGLTWTETITGTSSSFTGCRKFVQYFVLFTRVEQ